MKFVCKPNMALHLNREIRPNVVLEEHICAFGKKNVFERESEKRGLGLRRNQGFGGRSSPFLVSK